MTTKDEALKMALDALTCVDDGGHAPGHRCGRCDDYVDRNCHVRAALREALAQQDESVVTTTTIEALEQEIYENTRLFVPTAVMQWMLSKYHTAPPKRKPLTVEGINEIAESMPDGLDGYPDGRCLAEARAVVVFDRVLNRTEGVEVQV